MGEACSTYGRGAYRKILRERDSLVYPGIDGKIVLRWTFRKWDGGMDWIDLAEYRDRWRALVNALMNLRVQ